MPLQLLNNTFNAASVGPKAFEKVTVAPKAGESATYTTQLADILGVDAPLATFSAITLTFVDEVTGSVINFRQDQNVLNANNVTVSATGLLTWNMQVADNSRITATTNNTIEYHRAIFSFVYDFGTGEETAEHEIRIPVRQSFSGLVPFVLPVQNFNNGFWLRSTEVTTTGVLGAWPPGPGILTGFSGLVADSSSLPGSGIPNMSMNVAHAQSEIITGFNGQTGATMYYGGYTSPGGGAATGGIMVTDGLTLSSPADAELEVTLTTDTGTFTLLQDSASIIWFGWNHISEIVVDLTKTTDQLTLYTHVFHVFSGPIYTFNFTLVKSITVTGSTISSPNAGLGLLADIPSTSFGAADSFQSWLLAGFGRALSPSERNLALAQYQNDAGLSGLTVI